MSYGIEIRNEDSKVIINEERANFSVRGSGTHNFASSAYTVDTDGTIPNSGISGFGQIVNSDFIFAKPYSSSGFSSFSTVHCENTLTVGAKTGRLLRKLGRNEAAYGTTPTTKPPQFKTVQLAANNTNGFTVNTSSGSNYGLEILDSSGDVTFTTTGLTEYFVIDAILSWGSQGTKTSAGESWPSAYEATFTAPSGADIYDYYVLFNYFNFRRNPGNIHFGMKAEYRHSTRTIRFISSSNIYPAIVGRLA